MNSMTKFTIAAIILLGFLPVSAEAKKGGKSHGNSSYHQQEWQADSDSHLIINIDGSDREIIRNYIGNDYHRHCPPGLAKKNPACVPPGQAKKWRVGHALPNDIHFIPVSGDLLERLSPLPAGYQYVRVDEDVLLIGEAGKKVIDAVTLLSAVSN